MYDTEKYAKILKDTLSDRRFYHSLCVSQSAIKLAKRYGVDEAINFCTKHQVPEWQLSLVLMIWIL